jgi:transcriptional regulator with GAF, ATPase, and Fis domain
MNQDEKIITVHIRISRNNPIDLKRIFNEIILQVIQEVVILFPDNMAKAARHLGWTRTNLNYWMGKHGLRR